MRKRLMLALLLVPACYFLVGFILLLSNGKNCVPERLGNSPHDDWYFLTSTPRHVNFFCAIEPPVLLLGSANQNVAYDGVSGPGPVPEVGKWQVTAIQVRESWPFYLPYFAWSTADRRYSVGIRWDNVDHYFVLSITGHRQTLENIERPMHSWNLVLRIACSMAVFGIMIALLLPKPRRILSNAFNRRPYLVVIASLVMFALHCMFVQQWGWQTLVVLLYFVAPSVALWTMRRKGGFNWIDALVLVFIWLLFDFHFIGRVRVETLGSDWFLVSMQVTISVLMLWACLRQFDGMKLGWHWSGHDCWWTLGAFGALTVILVPLSLWGGFVSWKDQPILWNLPVAVLGIAVTIAIGEELVFRGLIQNVLQKYGQTVGWFAASLIFGAIHLHKGGSTLSPTGWNWSYAGLASIAGLGYGLVFRRTKSILYPVVLHAGVDATWHTLFK